MDLPIYLSIYMITSIHPANFLTAAAFRKSAEVATLNQISEGRYLVKIARNQLEIESALRLRYEVFNVELSAPAKSAERGLEFDDYDLLSQHLIVIDKSTGKTVGTYRLNSIETARRPEGFCSYSDFSIEKLPSEILQQGVEIGRACIASEHRNSKVLFLLWKGLLNHLLSVRKRYFFGCCSIFTQDCAIGSQVFNHFKKQGLIYFVSEIKPRAERQFCLEQLVNVTDRVELPGLFNLYLKIGAKVCGSPAIDRDFGTIDFFVIFDLLEMNEKYQRMFFRTENIAA